MRLPLPRHLLASEAAIPWVDVAGMRERLAHRYFDADHSIVTATVEVDLPLLVTAVTMLLDPFLVAEGVVDDISHEGLRALLREEGVSFT